MNEDELNKLIDFSNKIRDHWRDYETDIQDFIKSSDIKFTSEVCYIIVNSSEDLFNGIINSVIEENFYSATILYRALTEYYLRILYIILRSTKENNDNVGKEFKILLKENENRQFNNSITEINNHVKKIDLSLNTKILKPIDSKISSDQIKKVKSNFSYRNIIKYILSEYNKSYLPEPDDAFYYIVMQEYLELSSFVHGGPTSNEIFGYELNKDNCEGFYIHLVNRSLKMCNLEKYYSIKLFVNHDLKFSVPNLKILMELIDLNKKYTI